MANIIIVGSDGSTVTVSGGSPTSMGALTDIQFTSLGDEQLLQYNLSLAKWVNVASSSLGENDKVGIDSDATVGYIGNASN